MNPESAPHNGPNKTEVKPEDKMFDSVITTGVPRTGYVGIHEVARIKATQTPVRARKIALVMYL